MIDETPEDRIPIYVTVQVALDVAHVIHQHASPTPVSADLVQLIEELGVVLEPLHPGAEDALLIPFFRVEVPDLATAEEVITRLQQSPAIEAAFVKPPEALP